MRPNKRFYRNPTRMSIVSVLLLTALALPTALTLTARAEGNKAVQTASRGKPSSKQEQSTKSPSSSSMFKAYKVNKSVADFPDIEDFSTPERAYAVINRVMASGEQSAWQRISSKGNRGRVPPANAKKKEIKPEYAKMWLNAQVLEVRMVRNKEAYVLAEITFPSGARRIDLRHVRLEKDRWLNAGQADTARNLREARGRVARVLAKFAAPPPIRPKIEDPASYLKPFVEFLRDHAEEPKSFVMKALSTHKLVIMGEIHHRPRYWAFNSSLVTDPDFPKHVGTIYMELPSNGQHLVDSFLSAKECERGLIIEMLRDMLWMGWPDQPMLDFFMTVWRVNQNLPTGQKLRIVLADMKRPWKSIQKKEDWRKYNVDRDRFMAESILQDLRENTADKRNVLFIVGVGHTMLNLKYFEGSPQVSAGWHLREKLGADKVYAIFPHTCVMTNWGRVDGRLCLGLFDSAFGALGNKPMAFPLTEGPFGEQPFDAFPENPVSSPYRDGYSAYLYLGPLESEIFSPLIAGFYTDEFVKELDRRHRLMFGRGLLEARRWDGLSPESFINWMSNSWGKPRRRWTEGTLGPMNAWHRGGESWRKALRDEKHARVMENPEEVVQAARKLFEGIRDADYNYFLTSDKPDVWHEFPTRNYYMASSGHNQLVWWICRTFKDNPITSIELGDVFIVPKVVRYNDLPTVPYKLTLKDGTVLEGNLPFNYELWERVPHWHGLEGIDWHLQSRKKPTAAPAD